jgi:hypothetical protein
VGNNAKWHSTSSELASHPLDRGTSHNRVVQQNNRVVQQSVQEKNYQLGRSYSLR